MADKNLDKKLDRELANTIWLVVKGYDMPSDWTDKDVQEIIVRYWSRAIAKAEG